MKNTARETPLPTEDGSTLLVREISGVPIYEILPGRSNIPAKIDDEGNWRSEDGEGFPGHGNALDHAHADKIFTAWFGARMDWEQQMIVFDPSQPARGAES